MTTPSEEKAKLNPMEKMRVRLAAESYKSFENEDEGKKSHSGKKQDNQVMCVLLIVAMIIIALLASLLIIQHWWFMGKETCNSPDCIQMSGDILGMMDLNVDPCEDFYQYSCAYMDKDPLIPPEYPKYGAFSKLAKYNSAIIKKLLEEPGNKFSGGQSDAIKKVKHVFNVCMNVSEKEGNEKYMKELLTQLGTWPAITPSWKESSYDLEDLFTKVQLLGSSPLYSITVSQDDKNSSLNRIMVDQSGLSFANYENYIGNKSKKYEDAYIQFFTDVATSLGAPKATVHKDAQDVWNLEAKIAQIQDRPENRTDPNKMYHIMTREQLQEFLRDSMNVSQVFNQIFPNPVTATEHMIVYAPDYIRKIADVIKPMSKRTMANYMLWHIVQSLIGYMPKDYEQMVLRLSKVLTGVDTSPPQWEKCVNRASSFLGFAVGAMFTDEVFSEGDKEEGEEIVSRIRETFINRLPTLDWMDETTKARAIDKANNVKELIGYPDFIKNATALDEYYAKLNITDSSFQSVLSLLHFSVNKVLNKRNQKPDFSEWEMIPSEVNAYYTPVRNQIVFPAAIFGVPFYKTVYPMAMKIGGIGMVMGHELTHGFDSMGRMYDKYGNLNNWWQDDAAKSFEKKTMCLQKQYSQYKVGDKHLNGLTTLGENIADNGGMRVAYQSYHTWLQENAWDDRNVNLPGLNMTNDQLFFLSFAQMWCTKYKEQYAEQSLVTDVHSFAKYRVIGVLSNTPEFSEAFQCKAGSPMNPETKCDVW